MNMDAYEASVLAANRLKREAVHTPLVRSDLLDEQLGGRLLVKAENLQRTGSFKFRGAYNKIAGLDVATRNRGVVTYSSGNHGQAVALAARLFGISATVVMPRDAPGVKVENTRRYGAEIVLYDRASESREAIGEEICARTGATIVPPFDDPDVMAGQGTIALEIIEQMGDDLSSVDAILAGASGGGLMAGIAAVCEMRAPHVAIHPVEPENFDDLCRSLSCGERQRNEHSVGSICDALLGATPGVLPFSVLRRRAMHGYTVSDVEVRAAMLQAFRHLRLVLEPGGAAALAAVLSGKFPLYGRTVVVVASGGNVDETLFQQLFETTP
jgi:threonine dehydratase